MVEWKWGSRSSETHVQKNKIRPLLLTTYKTTHKWTKDLIIRPNYETTRTKPRGNA
jgi:hypothetical protein